MKKKLYSLLALLLIFSLLCSMSVLATDDPIDPELPGDPGVADNPDDNEAPDDTEDPDEEEGFVYPDDWSRDALIFAVENGIFRGDQYGNLNHEANITRAEMAAVLVRLLGATESQDLSTYHDVDPTAWYVQELGAAVAAGIFGGISDTTMLPNEPLTREQAVVVLCRAFGIVSENRTAYTYFADSDFISSFARDSVSTMRMLGLVNGYSDNTFGPHRSITRAEVAQLLYNILDCIADTPEEIPTSGRVLYRGTEALPAELSLDGSLILGQCVPSKFLVTNWDISGTLTLRTGKNTAINLSNLTAEQLVCAPLSGSISSSIEVVYLWGTVSNYHGNTHKLIVMGGNHSYQGYSDILLMQGGSLLHNGSAGPVTIDSNASLKLKGNCGDVAVNGHGSSLTLGGQCNSISVIGSNATVNAQTVLSNISLSGYSANVSVNQSCGNVSITGRYSTLTVGGTAKQIDILGYNSNVVINGSCGNINVLNMNSYVADTAITLTVNGTCGDILIPSRYVIITVNGTGSAKIITNHSEFATVSLNCTHFNDVWQETYEHDNALNVVQTMRVPCDVLVDTKLYSSQGYGYICDVPKGTIVYNEWHPAGTWFYCSLPNGVRGWIPRWDCYIPDDVVTTDGTLDYSDATKEGFVDLLGYESKTDYLIWVSRYTQKVIVYQGKKGDWEVYKTFPCSSGENNTPTPAGIFATSIHGGYWNFDNYYVTNVTIFNGDHAFHSVLKSYSGGYYDDRVGIPLSHGCVRMLESDCYFITQLPLNTTVIVY